MKCCRWATRRSGAGRSRPRAEALGWGESGRVEYVVAEVLRAPGRGTARRIQAQHADLGQAEGRVERDAEAQAVLVEQGQRADRDGRARAVVQLHEARAIEVRAVELDQRALDRAHARPGLGHGRPGWIGHQVVAPQHDLVVEAVDGEVEVAIGVEVGQIVTGGDGNSYVIVSVDETGVSAMPLTAFVEYEQPVKKVYRKKRNKKRYSSYGYNLLGAAMEAKLQTPFQDLVLENVLKPLGMTATSPDTDGARSPDRAQGYSVAAREASLVPKDDLSGRWPSGGYLMTTGDMARLGRSILAPGFLTAASLSIMLTPQRLASNAATSVGIGWRIGVDASGRTYAHHGGSSNGGGAFLLVFPAQRLVVAMASNAFTSWGEKDALAVANEFLKVPL